MNYEGDTTICNRCGNIHYLTDEIPVFCERCSFDMRLVLTPEDEKALIETLDSCYTKTRVDDLQ